jgi:hypothetical protein
MMKSKITALGLFGLLGKQVCPQADSTSFLTPCAIGIPPVEHPNQDHEICTTLPLNCPL